MRKLGESGFNKIVYGGKPILFGKLTVDPTTHSFYFDHLYQSSFGLLGKRRHSCLKMGVWCWSDVFEHPMDAYRFITWRIRAWILSR